MMDMVMIGLFIPPIVISMMNDPWFLYAWMAGSITAYFVYFTLPIFIKY